MFKKDNLRQMGEYNKNGKNKKIFKRLDYHVWLQESYLTQSVVWSGV